MSSIGLADIIMAAYPPYEDELVIEHPNGSRSGFKLCRICGSLVLASMSMTHVMVLHPVGDPTLEGRVRILGED